MPIYMDVHIVPGVKARDVAEAHSKDLLHQHEHGCRCMTYWIDEQRENIFCLVEAPTKEAVINMHNQAHGLIPNKVIEVSSELVDSFLGRIYDPSDAKITDGGLKVFSEPSFRILLVITTPDPILLRHRMGEEKAGELLDQFNQIVRTNLESCQGREVEHEGSDFIISFAAGARAVTCALAIQKDMKTSGMNINGFRIALNAGEPVESSNDLFGDTIEFATSLCTIADDLQIAVASCVRDLVSKDYFQKGKGNFLSLSGPDEILLVALFNNLSENWQNSDFDIANYCQAMTMSKSQLYRKTIAITGLSPNLLLKEYRLEKAKRLMKKQGFNIAQITFDSGFTSASYFTKCFKKKYGLLPMVYMDHLL